MLDLNVEDKVWLIEGKEKGSWQTCPACQGTANKIIDGYKFRCTTCMNGKTYREEKEFIIVENIVVRKTIIETKSSKKIKFVVNDSENDGDYGYYFDWTSKDLYTTKEEANKALVKRKKGNNVFTD
jgi:hypothetical protein